MSEELQPLLEQIRKEGVDKAQAEAQQILADAKAQAKRLIEDANAQVSELVTKAESDAAVFTVRSEATLEQAGRDLLITVGQGIENIVSGIVDNSVAGALKGDVLKEMMVKLAQGCAEKQGETRVEMLVSEADQKALLEYFLQKTNEKIVSGVELHVDSEILSGFKVSYADSRVYLDFTQEAIADALTTFLRPNLAKIVSNVAKQTA